MRSTLDFDAGKYLLELGRYMYQSELVLVARKYPRADALNMRENISLITRGKF